MGSGKSTVGRAIADDLNFEFIDTDSLITQTLGWPIPKLFQLYGEDTFRQHETRIVRRLEPGNAVVSTGGGIVTRPENWPLLRRLGVVIYLDTPLNILIHRLEQTRRKRPLLAEDDWEARLEQLLAHRLPLYRQADVVVPIEDGTIDEMAAKVIGEVRNSGKLEAWSPG